MYVSYGLLLAMGPPIRLSPVSAWPLEMSLSSAGCVASLASGNIEANPGPPRKHLVSIGSLNIRSSMKKAVVLHDIISERQLDVLEIQESWISSDAPAAVKNDIAPVRYTALHVHRELRPDGPKRGCGLAVIHRNSLVVRDFSLPTGSIQPRLLRCSWCISHR